MEVSPFHERSESADPQITDHIEEEYLATGSEIGKMYVFKV